MSNCRVFTCIVCPNGCTVQTRSEPGKPIAVTGNKCRRGEEYVLQELTDPRRTIATTVPVDNGELPLCSVRLTRAIPKRDIFPVMEEIRKVRLTAPVRIGQEVIHNVCGLDSDVIVTKNLAAEETNATGGAGR